MRAHRNAPHQISSVKLERLEDELRHCVPASSLLSLILPCQYSEITGNALAGIVEHLKGPGYCEADWENWTARKSDSFATTKEFFSSLHRETVIIWNNSAFHGILLLAPVDRRPASDTASGKGRSLWMAIGYLLPATTQR